MGSPAPAPPSTIALSEHHSVSLVAHRSSDRRPVATLCWSALPVSLQRVLGSAAPPVWISPETRQARFGLSIESSTTEPEANYQLQAWILIQNPDSPDEPGRHIIFNCSDADLSGAPRRNANNGTPSRQIDRQSPISAEFLIANGRVDRFSADVTMPNGTPVCRMTYVVSENGRAIWWADSILPEWLGLEGGRYELECVEVPDIDIAAERDA